MFQILSFKRFAQGPAHDGPGDAAIPDGNGDMPDLGAAPALSRAERDALYAEAIQLAEQARSWFNGPGKAWRSSLPLAAQTAVAIETLALNARLVAAIAWLSCPETTPEMPRNHPGNVPEMPRDHPLKSTFGGEISDATRLLLARLARNS